MHFISLLSSSFYIHFPSHFFARSATTLFNLLLLSFQLHTSHITMASAILFEDIFDIKQINPDGKKFENGKSSHIKYQFFVSPHTQRPLYLLLSAHICTLCFTVNRLHCRGTTYDIDLTMGKWKTHSWLPSCMTSFTTLHFLSSS